MTGTDTAPPAGDFEALFVNNAAFGDIDAHLRRFNPIRVMKMESMEIRHSAILGWLMDPVESHGLGDAFLKAFLAEALRGRGGTPSALDVARADLSDALVRVEWNHIDLSAHLRRADERDWFFVIENKFHAGEHGDQLRRYRELADRTFGDRAHVCPIFLSLWEDEPSDGAYAPIGYETLLSVLDDTMGRRAVTPEVGIFIQHYMKIIREALDMDDDAKAMEELARQLYRDHRKVIDFIVEHGATTDLGLAARNLFGHDVEESDGEDVEVDGYEYEFGTIYGNHISFLPTAWTEHLYADPEGHVLEWEGCGDWWMEYPLVCWLELQPGNEGTSGRLVLYGEVGPVADHDARVGLIDRVEGAAADTDLRIRFRSNVREEGRRYSKFFARNTEAVEDVHDSDELESAARKLLKRFRPEFDAIGKALEDAHKLDASKS